MIFAVVSALAVCGPALFWRFKKGIRLGDAKSSCPPCVCDCPPPLSLLKIAPGIFPSLFVLFGRQVLVSMICVCGLPLSLDFVWLFVD